MREDLVSEALADELAELALAADELALAADELALAMLLTGIA